MTDEGCRRKLLEIATSIVDANQEKFDGQVFKDLWREAKIDIARAIAKGLHRHWIDKGIVTDRMGHDRPLEEILDDSADYLNEKAAEISEDILGRLRLRSWLWDAKFDQDMRASIIHWMEEHKTVGKKNLSDGTVEAFVEKCIRAIHRKWQNTLDHYSEAIPVPKAATLRGQGLPGDYVIPEDLEHLRMLSFGYLAFERLGATRLKPEPDHVTEIEDDEGDTVNIYEKVADPNPIGARAEQQSEIWLDFWKLASQFPPEDATCVELIKRFAETALEQDYVSMRAHCTRNNIPYATLEKCLRDAKKHWRALMSKSSSEGEE